MGCCFSSTAIDEPVTVTKMHVLGPKRAGKSSFINFLYVLQKNCKKENIHELKEVLIPSKYIEKAPASGNNDNQYQINYKGLWKITEIQGIDIENDETFDSAKAQITKASADVYLVIMNGAKSRKDFEFESTKSKISDIIKTLDSKKLFLLFTNCGTAPNIDPVDYPNDIPTKHYFNYDNVLFSLNLEEEAKSARMLKKIGSSFEDCLDVVNKLLDSINNEKAKK